MKVFRRACEKLLGGANWFVWLYFSISWVFSGWVVFLLIGMYLEDFNLPEIWSLLFWGIFVLASLMTSLCLGYALSSAGISLIHELGRCTKYQLITVVALYRKLTKKPPKATAISSSSSLRAISKKVALIATVFVLLPFALIPSQLMLSSYLDGFHLGAFFELSVSFTIITSVYWDYVIIFCFIVFVFAELPFERALVSFLNENDFERGVREASATLVGEEEKENFYHEMDVFETKLFVNEKAESGVSSRYVIKASITVISLRARWLFSPIIDWFEITRDRLCRKLF